MAKLAIIIPSRNEPFLNRTIQDVFEKARGEVEVVVSLDGYWPDNWVGMTARYPNLHTVHHGEPIGMRGGINSAVASACSRGAKYIGKFDAHCMFSEGFDEVLKADCEPDWIVVPRRKRLNPETWTLTDTHKPDVDYHYLSFPDDPNDFGGPGLNGKIWPQRAVERADYEIDEEMSSQGSGWFMHTDYFYRLELMDEANYGKFWNEFQELGLKCWLSGGRVMVNKRAWYAHWHKGKAGRGYHLPESWLQQGATFTKNWMYNDAWAGQTKPFKWLIEHFWPVPTWPDDWEGRLYATKIPRAVPITALSVDNVEDVQVVDQELARATERRADVGVEADSYALDGLVIHFAAYGCGPTFTEQAMNVTEQVRELVKDGSLDIVVNNAALTPGQNPFRGKKKKLWVTYSYDGGEPVTVTRDEKDWLIIGQVQRDIGVIQRQPLEPLPSSTITTTAKEVPSLWSKSTAHLPTTAAAALEAKSQELMRQVRLGPEGRETEQEARHTPAIEAAWAKVEKVVKEVELLQKPPMTATALNDYLIRKFSISPQRLRGPMPIELRDFHRNDLAQLFAELGFKRGAEIGVAEGNYSEVLLKANPECELLLVDPWHAYSDNPQNKSKEKDDYAYQQTLKKTKDYLNVKIHIAYSMDAVRKVDDNSLDFCYIDGHHSYPYVMADIIEWSKKVRSGGVVAGDDVYTLNEKWGAGPMEAIYDYTRAMKIGPWFLIDAHRSVDFFFVRP